MTFNMFAVFNPDMNVIDESIPNHAFDFIHCILIKIQIKYRIERQMFHYMYMTQEHLCPCESDEVV